MLSSIRFSCSLAAAEGPWEETTDEAEKNLLRISSFFLILVRNWPGHPGKQGVSRVSKMFLHPSTQLILAGGDLICKDAADDVLMFLSFLEIKSSFPSGIPVFLFPLLKTSRP